MGQSVSNEGAGSGSMSSSLLERIYVQDPEAWCRLVRLYGPVVYGWCRQSGLQPADAADVVQDLPVHNSPHNDPLLGE